MYNTYQHDLESLLSESEESMRLRERTTFDNIAAETTGTLVLFGTGGLGRRVLAGLRKLGIKPVAFSDNNPKVWGKTVEGIPVMPPQEAVEHFGGTAVFVLTIYSDQLGHPLAKITAQLQNYGEVRVASFVALFWKYPAVFLPYFGLELPHKICSHRNAVRQSGELWRDEISQRQYLAQIRWRLWLDPDSMDAPEALPEGSIYDNPGNTANPVILDCGAFNGDTVKEIICNKTPFKHLLAFEPDPANCTALREYIKTLPQPVAASIKVFQMALGDRHQTLRFSADGSNQSAASADGVLEVECVPLDAVAHHYRPTCIKMDIEGAEPDALRGARQIIDDYA
jgi:FkbM family methyltransferase